MSETAKQIVAALESFEKDGTRPRLMDIHHHIAIYFQRYLETTTISAAIRKSVRPMLATRKRGYMTVDNKQASSTRKVHVYWLRKMTAEEKRKAKAKAGAK